MTRTVEVDVPEHGNTPTNVVSPDGTTDRNGNYSSKTSETVYNDNKMQNQSIESESSKQRTNEMTNFMDDLSLNSPKERQSRSRSKTRSIKCRSSRSSSSSSSGSSSSGSSSSRSSGSSSRSRSRSRSYDRKYSHKRSRRSSRSYSRGSSRSYSRSYSRSRSRSYSPRQRRRYSSAYRRYYRSPPRYRSRSRSRSYRRSRYSRSRSSSRSRRYYGFVRRPYSPTFRTRRSRSKTRSRSRTPLRLSEKEKLKLLEIAKMNASKALGKEVEIPDSLRKSTERSKTSAEKDKQRSDKWHKSSSVSSVYRTLSQEKEEAVKEQADNKRRSSYSLWRPVTNEAKSFSNGLSPKEAHKSHAR
ncbi:arginine/serine-rich protein 1 isoform X1 [Pyxicephalus adspersus]|uniref:Arginine/serine-rich protein 1 n=1 Tax=Pyxicephalus adspersus TaxID=30357 RepID=A0AAV3B6E8_PYXAD|nr:TPA: hypothetical protein GDO54_001254 [Pyxicephalus adspersus]